MHRNKFISSNGYDKKHIWDTVPDGVALKALDSFLTWHIAPGGVALKALDISQAVSVAEAPGPAYM